MARSLRTVPSDLITEVADHARWLWSLPADLPLVRPGLCTLARVRAISLLTSPSLSCFRRFCTSDWGVLWWEQGLLHATGWGSTADLRRMLKMPCTDWQSAAVQLKVLSLRNVPGRALSVFWDIDNEELPPTMCPSVIVCMKFPDLDFMSALLLLLLFSEPQLQDPDRSVPCRTSTARRIESYQNVRRDVFQISVFMPDRTLGVMMPEAMLERSSE